MGKNIFDYNSIEELRANLEEAMKDNGIAMRLIMMDKDGKPRSVDIREIIDDCGIEEATRILYEAREKAKELQGDGDDVSGEFSLTGEQVINLLEKFKDDPDSLTERERLVVDSVLNSRKTGIETATEIIAIIMKTFNDLGGRDLNTVAGLASVMITILSGNIIMSTEAVDEAPAIFNEKVNAVMQSIKLPENVDKTIIAMALLQLFGNIVVNDNFRGYKLNHKEFLKVFNLENVYEDMDKLMEDNPVTKENKPVDNKAVVNIKDRIKNNK